MILGRHTTLSELSESQRKEPYEHPPKPKLTLPIELPISAVNPLTTRMFNTVYYWKGLGKRRKQSIVSAYKYFYPLDVAIGWNKLYSSAGFVQYQFVVPLECGYDVVHKVLTRCIEAGHPASLSVLKRFGAQDGYLSFPRPGWTLAMDIAIRKGLMELLDELDEIVVKNGGRIYLAKDVRMKPETFRKLYPEYPTWLEVKRRVDPHGRFSSDQSRRLEIDRDVNKEHATMTNPTTKLNNAWLIVGATGGIGSAVAREFASRGNDLVLVDLPATESKLKQLSNELQSGSKIRTEFRLLGESTTAGYDALLNDIEQSCGELTGVLWAAGVMWPQAQLQFDSDKAALHHSINYTMPMLFLERVATPIREARNGSHSRDWKSRWR